MHFCLTGQYTPQALNSMMKKPNTNRHEAIKKLVESCGRQTNIDVARSSL